MDTCKAKLHNYHLLGSVVMPVLFSRPPKNSFGVYIPNKQFLTGLEIIFLELT